MAKPAVSRSVSGTSSGPRWVHTDATVIQTQPRPHLTHQGFTAGRPAIDYAVAPPPVHAKLLTGYFDDYDGDFIQAVGIKVISPVPRNRTCILPIGAGALGSIQAAERRCVNMPAPPEQRYQALTRGI